MWPLSIMALSRSPRKFTSEYARLERTIIFIGTRLQWIAATLYCNIHLGADRPTDGICFDKTRSRYAVDCKDRQPDKRRLPFRYVPLAHLEKTVALWTVPVSQIVAQLSGRAFPIGMRLLRLLPACSCPTFGRGGYRGARHHDVLSATGLQHLGKEASRSR